MFIRTKWPVPKLLYRYTTLPILLDVLRERHITLLRPETWADQNDAYYLKRYQHKMKLDTLLAICFARHRETFHYWHVFANGPSGVCIQFDGQKLLKHFTDKEFHKGRVTYRWIREISQPLPASWPFLKRKAFEDEHEYRIIYESKDHTLDSKPISIALSSILKVALSPWLHKDIAPAVTKVIKSIKGCSTLTVIQSSLINNAEWQAAIDKKRK